MPGYDATDFRPPAPIALVTVRSPTNGKNVENIAMLLDTGADVSLLPSAGIASLVEIDASAPRYELESFDGTRSTAPVVQMELLIMGKSFRGQFLLIDGPYGILGRNILNSLKLSFDGPAQIWNLY